MKKNIIIILLVLIILALGGYLYLNIDSEGNSLNPFTKNEFDIIEHSQQYNLLYSLNITNSLKPKCEYNDIEYSWDFQSEKKLSIYKTTENTVYLENLSSEESETYETITESIDNYYSKQPAVSNLIYDYEVSVYSDTQSTYEKMPLFTKKYGLKIYTTNLGVWRNNDNEYATGLYAVSNSFPNYIFDTSSSFLTFEPLNEKKTKDLIENSNIKFVNHELLCENTDIEKTEVNSIEVIYINISEYLFPIYKIIGSFEIQNQNIKWSALINPVDYSSQNYNSFKNKDSEDIFIPQPFIDNIELQNDNYFISGYLSNKLIVDSNEHEAESVEINFFAKEETGEYVYGGRKENLIEEINNSLEIEESGKFSFHFSSDNFWKVEKLIYNESNSESEHSKENEIDRNTYDNWFQIQVCSTYDIGNYCSPKSRIDRLER